MRYPIATIALALALASPALAFDTAIEDVIDQSKRGKPVPIAMVADLMMGAQKWCYLQAENACNWSDTYLFVQGNDVSFEIAHAWNEAIDIAYVTAGVLREGRFICETGFDWVPSVRGSARDDGVAIGGRDLAALRLDIEQWANIAGATDCFDYVFEGTDAETQTIKLLQRQFVDGVTDSANDVSVTLHFDPATAQALGLY